MFDIINRHWQIWKCETNINNYVWRKIMCNNSFLYESQYKKEQDLRKLRQSILDKLK